MKRNLHERVQNWLVVSSAGVACIAVSCVVVLKVSGARNLCEFASNF